MGFCPRHGLFLDPCGQGTCPYCTHEPGRFSFTVNLPHVGWSCPRCGFGIAPNIERCPCAEPREQAERSDGESLASLPATKGA